MTIDDLYIILLSDKPSEELKKHEQALFELIPELEICKGFEQKNDWHIYDVYEHILHVVDYIPKDITLRLAALFHDIGKPILYKEDENGIRHFYGHWDESKKIFDAFSEKYNIDKELSNSVSTLIQYHDISSDKLTQEDIDKLGINGIKRLFIFKKADLRAQNKKYHYISDDYKNQEDNLLLKLKGENSMEKEIKKYEIIEKVLIAFAIIIGVITVVDIFLPDPVFMLDEASLAAITGLLTYLSSLVRKKIEELKNGEKKKIDSKEIEEITSKVTETANAVNRSRKKK